VIAVQWEDPRGKKKGGKNTRGLRTFEFPLTTWILSKAVKKKTHGMKRKQKHGDKKRERGKGAWSRRESS